MKPIAVTKTWHVLDVAEPHNLKFEYAYVSKKVLFKILKLPLYSFATISPIDEWPKKKLGVLLNIMDPKLPGYIQEEVREGKISLPYCLMEDVKEQVVLSSDLMHILYNENIKLSTKYLATVNYLLRKGVEK